MQIDLDNFFVNGNNSGISYEIRRSTILETKVVAREGATIVAQLWSIHCGILSEPIVCVGFICANSTSVTEIFFKEALM